MVLYQKNVSGTNSTVKFTAAAYSLYQTDVDDCDDDSNDHVPVDDCSTQFYLS